MEFGPLEYAILGNGILLLLLFIILIYTIYRLRKVSVEKRLMREKEMEESTLDVFSPDAPHQSFSTLCGFNLNAQTERPCWSSTLPLPPKKSVRINDTKSSIIKGSNSNSNNPPLEPFNPYTNNYSNTLGHHQHHHQQQSAVWVTFPAHQAIQPGFYPSYATLNIPVKKGHRCQRAHSCRMPALLAPPPQPILLNHAANSSTLHKKLNVDYLKY